MHTYVHVLYIIYHIPTSSLLERGKELVLIAKGGVLFGKAGSMSWTLRVM